MGGVQAENLLRDATMRSMEQVLHDTLKRICEKNGIDAEGFSVTYPPDLSQGDYATNIALIAAKKMGKKPQDIAHEIVTLLQKEELPGIEAFSVADPGFINIHLDETFFHKTIRVIQKDAGDFGKNSSLKNKKILIEYTDPNVMKPFHIGHLMSNAIGEVFARLADWNGANVTRANYFSDVGLGIAKAVWGMNDLRAEIPTDDADIVTKTDFLGRAYVHGVTQFEADEAVMVQVKKINKLIYEKSEEGEWFALYEKGKRWSLEHFEHIYETLGSSFDTYYPESEVAEEGKQIVRDGLKQGVFAESEGAVVFHGEHTRVFLSSEGLPTYEAKELALNKEKFEDHAPDESVVITANEQDAYFRVVLEAMHKLFPDIAERTTHISHGMMRFVEGKMSSRKGNVITGESLITDIEARALERMDERDQTIAKKVAVAAVKYSILKQTPGKDSVFDPAQALSLEGDSGPYLQYTVVRAQSVLARARELNLEPAIENVPEGMVTDVQRLLHRFPEILLRAEKERAPQLVVTYLTELASSFNTFYAGVKIVDPNDVLSPYWLSLTNAVATVLTNGLSVLAITVPERM